MIMGRQVACCYHPTTVISVDDNTQYHAIADLAIDHRTAVCQFYDDPRKALKFLKEQYRHRPFINDCVLESGDPPLEKRRAPTNTHSIWQEIYDPERFQEISTVILDFAMPGMNGGELAQELKEFPFKIILLTGEANTQVAIELFNKGVIHSYIKKDDPHFDTILNRAIYNLQQQYFIELSSAITSSLSFAKASGLHTSWFKDPAFTELFEQLCRDNDVTEYYLLDAHGSYLFLDSQGKPSWFILADEEQMKTYSKFIEHEKGVPSSVLQAVKSKRKIPYFHNHADWESPREQWEKYLHPVDVFQGKETYYYAHITNPKAYDIESAKILSYQHYLNQTKN